MTGGRCLDPGEEAQNLPYIAGRMHSACTRSRLTASARSTRAMPERAAARRLNPATDEPLPVVASSQVATLGVVALRDA